MIRYAPLVAAVFFLLASCATVDQTIKMAPLSTSFPVSASQTLQVGDKTYDDSQFQQTQEFSTKKVVKAHLSDKEIDLGLTPLLNDQMRGSSFNGVTKLRIDVQNVDNSTPAWVVFEQNWGVSTALVGAWLYAFSDPSAGGSRTPGLITMGVGTALFGLSFLHASVGTVDYTFNVSGLKVKY